jgi:hypothetical protein
MNKIKKDLTLAESTVKFIFQYKEEHSSSSFSAAIDDIINQFEKYEKGFIDEIGKNTIDKIKGEYADDIKKIRFSSNVADFNTQVIIELLNTLLINMQVNNTYISSEVTSDVLIACQKTVMDRIADRKQRKENNKYRRSKYKN